jgi:hypothetical protein
VSRSFLDLGHRLWQELQNFPHDPGAIRCKRSKTSVAGTG